VGADPGMDGLLICTRRKAASGIAGIGSQTSKPSWVNCGPKPPQGGALPTLVKPNALFKNPGLVYY
jgi:hypothetical protein